MAKSTRTALLRLLPLVLLLVAAAAPAPAQEETTHAVHPRRVYLELYGVT